MTEKKLTGYPSIDKPWLKHYTEKWSKDLIPQKTVYRNIYDALPVAPSSKLNVTAMKANHNNLITLQ